MLMVEQLDVDLNRDVFLRQLLHHLVGALQDTVGLHNAEGFISLVGQTIGEETNQLYRKLLGQHRLDQEQVIAVLLDLKRRINGDFYLIFSDKEKIVFGNRRCPFEQYVAGRPALCMMTSNVFGLIAAENLGYAKVVISEAFAQGHERCCVTLYLSVDHPAQGQEYFGSEW